MYVILVQNDNSLLVTQKQRLMQRSKLVDSLWFLAEQEYNGYQMRDFTAYIEYVLPVSRTYKTEFLVLSDEMYNGHLKYVLPINTELTSEAGEIEIQMTFTHVDIDADGNKIQRVRKISPTTICILPLTEWSNIIPDEALTALDQRVLKIDAQMKALEDMNMEIAANKADGLSFSEETSELQLTSGGKAVGNVVMLGSRLDGDGIPVTEFGPATVTPDGDVIDVVLF